VPGRGASPCSAATPSTIGAQVRPGRGGRRAPDRLVRNSGARPGDVLVLTKPLGTGVVATAIKADAAPAEVVRQAVA